MKLTGHACTEATSGAEEAVTRERTEGNAGGVRVELRVRPITKLCFVGVGLDRNGRPLIGLILANIQTAMNPRTRSMKYRPAT